MGRGAGRPPVSTLTAAHIATAAMASHMERMGAAAGLAARGRRRYPRPREGGARSGAMTTLKRSWTRVGNHIGVDVPHVGRPAVQRQQGRPRRDDHDAGPPYRHPPLGPCPLPRDVGGSRRLGHWLRLTARPRLVPEPARGPYGPGPGTGRKFAARPHELHGEERDTLWRDAIPAQAPEVSRYAQMAGRTIPVAVLEPV